MSHTTAAPASQKKQLRAFAITAALALALPILLQITGGDGPVRILGLALLYVMLALGLNIVVGYAGLLDLGYVAFYAVGAYLFALLASPHLTDNFPALAAQFPQGLHIPIWLALPLAAAVAGLVGVLLGIPVLRLRGDYLAIVTLGFGEIIRVFLNNLDQPYNLTNGPKGIGQIDSANFLGYDLGQSHSVLGFELHSVTLYCYSFVLLAALSVFICYRLQDSRIGRAWMAMREDEIAAKAMGISTIRMKLLAFGMGATLGGVSGAMFASFQGFVSPESFSLMESVLIISMVVLGGLGHIPGVILGALLLAGLPEILRYVAAPLQQMTGGRLDAAILRQLLIALAMIVTMLLRPRGLWPAPEHGAAADSLPPNATPDSPQHNSPGIDFAADAVPRLHERRDPSASHGQDAVNP